jgi:hypothetical protein
MIPARRPAWLRGYDVDVPFVSLEQRGCGIHSGPYGGHEANTGLRARNAPENPIAPSWVTAYPGYMTTRQAPQRPGYMNPASRLPAALTGVVVAG